jgi:subtilisin family serine protease
MIRHFPFPVLTAVSAIALLSCGGHAPYSTAPRVGGSHSAVESTITVQGGSGVPRDVIVVLAEGIAISSFLQQYNLIEVEELTIEGTTYRLVQSQGPVKAEDLVDLLRKDGGVELVTLNHVVGAPEFDGEPMSFDDGDGRATSQGYLSQPLLSRLNAEAANAVSNGAAIRVAILDTGIDRGHPVWAGTTIVPGSDFSILPHGTSPDDVADGDDGDGDGLVDEAFGHGTHVAGIVHLVAPGTTLIAIKVLDDEGWGTCFGLAAGIMNAIKLGAGVINMSLGLTESNPMVAHAVRFAASRGLALVASAGNRASLEPQYPASYPGVYSVTAVDDHDLLATFANRNPMVAVSAPGVEVISLFPTKSALGLYAAGDGTSMAAPFMSGATALVLAARPDLDGLEAGARVAQTATPIDDLNPAVRGLIGHGRVDLLAPLLVSSGGSGFPRERMPMVPVEDPGEL